MSVSEFWEKARLCFEEAFSNGNLAGLDEFCDPKMVFSNPALAECRGLEAFKQMVLAARQSFTDIRHEYQETVVEGNTIATRFVFHATHTGPLLLAPVKATGKRLSWNGILFVHVKNGTVIEMFEVSNYIGLLQQLGIMQNQALV